MSEIYHTEAIETPLGSTNGHATVLPVTEDLGDDGECRALNLWLRNSLLHEREYIFKIVTENLLAEREYIFKAVGEHLDEFDTKVRALELQITEATGAIEVLRNERAAASTDISAVRDSLVSLTDRQAEKLAGLEIKLAEAMGSLRALQLGRTLRVCGTYNAAKSYQQHDVVIIDGSSFVALRDDAGDCPGPNWQLLCSAGRRGERGRDGAKGERGIRGETGSAAGIIEWRVDEEAYVATALMSDGSVAELNLRPLFDRFFQEAVRRD